MDEDDEIETRALHGLRRRARDRRSPLTIVVGTPEFEDRVVKHDDEQNDSKMPRGRDYTELDEIEMDAAR